MSAGNIIRPAFAWDAGHFTQMPNTWVRDQRISRRARGLLLELLSHGAAWQTSIRSLADAGPEGEAAIRVTLKELREAGYLRMQRERDAKQRLGQTDYVLQDPWSEPKCDSPHVEKPRVENRHTKKNNSQKNISQNAAPALLPAPEDEISEEWSRLRRADGHEPGGLTGPARTSLQRLLASGVSVQRVLLVLRWLHTDGRWWLDVKRPGVTLGSLRRLWASIEAQVPAGWQDPAEAASAAQDAAERVLTRTLQHTGLSRAQYEALDPVQQQQATWRAEEAAARAEDAQRRPQAQAAEGPRSGTAPLLGMEDAWA